MNGNPMQMLQMLMQGGKNPQQMIMNMIGKNNPMINSLMDMANKGDNKGIEKFARNICKEKGMDFDKDFSNFMNNVRGQNKQVQKEQTQNKQS